MLHLLHEFGGLLVLIGILIGILMMWRSAHRFIAEQQRLGRWDKNGPLHPTKGPPRRNLGVGASGMDERLEVTGQWTPEPLDKVDLRDRDGSN